MPGDDLETTLSTRGRITSHDVLTAAAEAVTRDGLDALSVRQLATDLGVSRQVVYTHFDGMPGLVRALYRHGFDLLAAETEQVDDEWSPVECGRAVASQPIGDRLNSGSRNSGRSPKERPSSSRTSWCWRP